MILFVISLIIAIWKIYVFLPDRVLEDNDTDKRSVEELESIMLECIDEENNCHKKIYSAMKEHDRFDKEHYWRFNENRLRHLLNGYFLKNKSVKTIEDIILLKKQ